jgi:hypothetical protein
MTKIQSDNKKSPISAKQILLAIVAVLLFALLLSSVFGLMNKYFAMRRHIRSLKQEKLALEQKKALVTNMNDYIDTKEGQERVFRDKYRLLKPGEGLIVVTNEEPISSPETRKPAIRRLWDSIKAGLGL